MPWFVRHPNPSPAHMFHVQDSYQQPIARMLDFFVTAYQENPATTLEVFVHKAESFAEDYKIGMWSRDITHIHLDLSPPYALRLCRTSDGPCRPFPLVLHVHLLTGRVKLLLARRSETYACLREFSAHSATCHRRIIRHFAGVRADAGQLPPHLCL